MYALQEGGGEPPKGALGWAIDMNFGSLETLVQKLNTEGAVLQGSGWVVCSYASLCVSLAPPNIYVA